ncbi:unnamed protein product [Ilex paraguariensis]|uniref:Uncharacterized protein n=1 Tax=Ilex paraguariensis TaxID=185542 RepID=A0ABC8V5D4_9AQUA
MRAETVAAQAGPESVDLLTPTYQMHQTEDSFAFTASSLHCTIFDPGALSVDGAESCCWITSTDLPRPD